MVFQSSSLLPDLGSPSNIILSNYIMTISGSLAIGSGYCFKIYVMLPKMVKLKILTRSSLLVPILRRYSKMCLISGLLMKTSGKNYERVAKPLRVFRITTISVSFRRLQKNPKAFLKLSSIQFLSGQFTKQLKRRTVACLYPQF